MRDLRNLFRRTEDTTPAPAGNTHEEKETPLDTTTPSTHVSATYVDDGKLLKIPASSAFRDAEEKLPGDLYSHMLIAAEWLKNNEPLPPMNAAEQLIMKHHFEGVLKALGKHQDDLLCQVGANVNMLSESEKPVTSIDAQRTIGRGVISGLEQVMKSQELDDQQLRSSYESWKNSPHLTSKAKQLLSHEPARETVVGIAAQYRALDRLRQELGAKALQLLGDAMEATTVVGQSMGTGFREQIIARGSTHNWWANGGGATGR